MCVACLQNQDEYPSLALLHLGISAVDLNLSTPLTMLFGTRHAGGQVRTNIIELVKLCVPFFNCSCFSIFTCLPLVSKRMATRHVC